MVTESNTEARPVRWGLRGPWSRTALVGLAGVAGLTVLGVAVVVTGYAGDQGAVVLGGVIGGIGACVGAVSGRGGASGGTP